MRGKNMSKIMEDFLKEERQEEKYSIHATLLECSYKKEEQIKELFNLVDKEMKLIKESCTVLG